MVKEFIRGIFKKKGKPQEAMPEQADVPDELPPLAEDVIKKPSDEKSVSTTPFSEEKHPTTFKDSADVAEELPPLSSEPSQKDSEIMEKEASEPDIAEPKEQLKE